MIEMMTWQKERYLDPAVWSHLQSKISLSALPGRDKIPIAGLVGPTGTATSLMETKLLVKMHLNCHQTLQYIIKFANPVCELIVFLFDYLLPAATKLWPRLCFYSCLSFC